MPTGGIPAAHLAITLALRIPIPLTWDAVVQRPQSERPPGTRLLDRLLQEGRIRQDEYQTALLHARRMSLHCEESVIAVGAITEGELLKYLAGVYKTRYVGTQKLSRAKIPESLLRMLPRKVAARIGAFPIMHDVAAQTLSVVAADLEAYDVAKQVQVVTGVRTVQVYVARPAAVEALIRKHYDRDRTAFASLRRELDGAEQAVQSQSGVATSNYPGAPATSSVDDLNMIALDLPSGLGGQLSPLEPQLSDPEPPAGSTPDAMTASGHGDPLGSTERRRPQPLSIDLSMPPVSFPEASGSFEEERPSARPRARAGVPTVAAMEVPKAINAAFSREAETRPLPTVSDNAGVSGSVLLGTTNVLVSLVENAREGLRGHSSRVARLCRQVGERLGLESERLVGLELAAQLHDLGKHAAGYHLTSLNVSRYEGHRSQARRAYRTPLRMFEGVGIPESTAAALLHMYERFDGEGFPERIKGKEIPLEARILAVADTFVDLTTHEKNPYRKVLDARAACDVLAEYGDSVFDPIAVDLLRTTVLGDDLKAQLLEGRSTILLVDPDPEETAVLELRLLEHGHNVLVERSAADAMRRLETAGADAIITEAELPKEDGFAFVSQVRGHAGFKELPVLFLTARADRASINQGFELGAVDYLIKPASAEVAVAKLTQVLSRRSAPARAKAGVSGALADMALPDLLQILANGRKSGTLTVHSDGADGQIAFVDGAIWSAMCGVLTGEDAVYEMLKWFEGDFSLDPEKPTDERQVQASTEAVLLEGMRRLDEGL